MRILVPLVRAYVVVMLFVYGGLKLAGGQFIYDEDFAWNCDGKGSLVTLVWGFFGRSRIYGTATGLAEVIPAILMLHSRTRTVGALIALPVMANVALMDLCYGLPIPATANACLLALSCVLLCWADRERLVPLFGTLTPPRADRVRN
jgi:hypothetical protein